MISPFFIAEQSCARSFGSGRSHFRRTSCDRFDPPTTLSG